MLLPFVLQSTSYIANFNVDGVRREALIFPGKAAPGGPVVFVFHGHGGNMRQASRSFDAQSIWPEATIVYPQGLPTKGMTDPQGAKPGWQQNVGEEGDRDLKFVDAMLASQKNLSPRRTFAMGHSNGGRFTYLLWSVRSAHFAAYGPSGSPAVLLTRTFTPAPYFATAGEADPIVPYASQKATIERVAQVDGVDLSKATKNGYVTTAYGKGGIEFGTYIHPGGHQYPQPAVEATLGLFKRAMR